MAGNLYITGYNKLTQIPGDAGQMPDESTLTEKQVIAIGASSIPSAALDPGTRFVRLHTDGGSPACIVFGFGTVGAPPAPVAIAGTDQRFAANQTEYKGVPTNGTGSGNAQTQVKIAAIAVA